MIKLIILPVFIGLCNVYIVRSSDSMTNVSMLATQMFGVCAKVSEIENYKVTCANSTSSSTIFPFKSAKPARAILSKDSVLVEKQNEVLLTELINRAVYGTKPPTQIPKYGFEQLSVILGIYEKICPVIPSSFLNTIFHLYSTLHWKTATDRTEYLPKKHQKWIMRLLHNCTADIVTPLPILTDPCKEMALASTNCTSYLCTNPAHEFRLNRADPIVDVVYKVHELVQAACFPAFRESYRMFHLFHLTVMDTITADMKTRWVTQVASYEYWKRLLGPYFEIHLVNMERCNEAGIRNSKLNYRILRKSLPARVRLTGVHKKV